MKQVVFFIPAIIHAVFAGGLLLAGAASLLSPIVYVWIALFVLSGAMLSKGWFWGGLIGILPGVHMMYMSTIDTGQVIDIEMPMGVVITTYYLLCAGIVYYRKRI